MRTDDAAVQELAGMALTDGAFAVLHGGARAADCKTRVGSLHGIGVSPDAFTHVFSVRRARDEHVNRSEGEALMLMLCWILRSSARHASRVVVMVDSAVVLWSAA